LFTHTVYFGFDALSLSIITMRRMDIHEAAKKKEKKTVTG